MDVIEEWSGEREGRGKEGRGAIDVRNDMSGDEKMSWVEVKKERKRWREEEKERKKDKLNEKNRSYLIDLALDTLRRKKTKWKSNRKKI